MARLSFTMSPLWAACFLASSTAVGAFTFPMDNTRARFREDTGVFQTLWDEPALLSGGKPTIFQPTDLTLHSNFNRTTAGESRWADALYPLEWEVQFEGSSTVVACRSWWWASYVASGLYLVALAFGNKAMKDRKAFDLKGPLALWNLFLAVFSFIGMVRTVPHLLMLLGNYGFEYTVCRAAIPMYGGGATGLWVAFFIFSKYFELIDTLFLVVRKKSVPFLHWYHHCSVLVYCWHAFVWEMPTGIYFVAMNYTVHSIMYFYYFLAAVTKPPKWALMVTIMQLSQMAVGIFVTVTHMRIMVYDKVQNCDGHVPNLVAALAMYASYFYLFAEFLVKRYCLKRAASAKPTKLAKKVE